LRIDAETMSVCFYYKVIVLFRTQDPGWFFYPLERKIHFGTHQESILIIERCYGSARQGIGSRIYRGGFCEEV